MVLSIFFLNIVSCVYCFLSEVFRKWVFAKHGLIHVYKVLFFLSTIPFIEVLSVKKSVGKCHSFHIKDSPFINWVAWSLLIEEIQKPFLFWTHLQNISKTLKDSCLCWIVINYDIAIFLSSQTQHSSWSK